MKKLALFLALCLLVSSLGLTAFAGDLENEAPVDAPEVTEPAAEEPAAEEPAAEEPAAEEPAAEEPAAEEPAAEEPAAEEPAAEEPAAEEPAAEEPAAEEPAAEEPAAEEPAAEEPAAEEPAAEEPAAEEPAAEEPAAEEAAEPASMTRELAAGTVLYADKELKEEIGTLSEDALVILKETDDEKGAAAVRYADVVDEAKAVKDAWVKIDDLKETDKDLKEDELKAVAFVATVEEAAEEPAAEEPAAENGEEEAAAEEEAVAEEPLNPEEQGLNNAAPQDFVVRADGTIIQYNGTSTAITLPLTVNGVTVKRLSEAVFANNGSIISVTMPNNIQVDAGAFRNCTALLSVSMHNSIDTISAECFEGCTKLQSVSWPEGLKTIGQGAFKGCTALTGVPSGTNLETLGDNAFSGCTSLTYVDLPDKLKTIGQGAFYGCTNLKEIIIPDSVEVIGNRAFQDCISATTLKLSKNSKFTIVNNYCFSGCRSITDITVPDNVTEIGREAFYNCSSAGIIRLPKNLTTVGNNAFYGRAAGSWIRWDECQNTPPVYIGTDALGTSGYVLAPVDSAAHNYTKTHKNVKFCSTKARDFVERCYTEMLMRGSDEPGLLHWCKQLADGTLKGGSLVKGFADSVEFTGRNLSNADQVKIMYKVMLDRGCEPAEVDYWKEMLDDGMSLDVVIHGFCEATEFINLCKSYLIEAGTVPLTRYRDKNRNVTKFVNRMYIWALNRNGEPEGIEHWCKLLLTKKLAPAKLAHQFVFSTECLGRNLNNLAFVEMLYHVYFDRGGEAEGINTWMSALAAGKTRQWVEAQFSAGLEYQWLLRTFGFIK